MINRVVQDLLLEEKDKLFITAEKVAILEEDHTLDHAMLVLTHVRYSLIPVVNRQNKLTGLISLAMILNQVATLEEIDLSQLHDFQVKEAMETEFPTITFDTDIEDVLNELVDHNFLCITNDEKEFVGIVTRKEVLKRVNYMVHELNKKYTIQEVIELHVPELIGERHLIVLR